MTRSTPVHNIQRGYMKNGTYPPTTRPFLYQDAVDLLEGKSKINLDAADRAATAALLIGGVIGGPGIFALLAPKNALVALGDGLLKKIPSRVKDSEGIDRTQLLIAAHTIIVITSFFDAASTISEIMSKAEVTLTGPEQLRSSTSDDYTLASESLINQLIDAEVPSPKPYLQPGDLEQELGEYYTRFAKSLVRFCQGLHFWDILSENERELFEDFMTKGLPGKAILVYQTNLRRLSAQVKEFEIWTNQLTSQEITRRFYSQNELIEYSIAQNRHNYERTFEKLENLTTYLDELKFSTASGHESMDPLILMAHAHTQLEVNPADVDRLKSNFKVDIPPLSKLYIQTPFKVVRSGGDSKIAKEDWWRNIPSRNNLDDFLSEYLSSSTDSYRNPLVILGHPGSGKSSLTRMLAATLPRGRYIPIRIELRKVSPESSIELQIEEGLALILGRPTKWQEFRDASELIPVLLFDGLDELIQASKEKQGDYIEQIQAFQQRELQFRGAIAMVTSRTVVADQARVPPDSMVLKLEDFRTIDSEKFIEVWNKHNRVAFSSNSISPFPIQLHSDVAQLAAQPLLLLLLVLLDADSNALQNSVGIYNKATTYGQIIKTFIGREVLKHHPEFNAAQTENVIQDELMKLSYVALGMFNRGLQMIDGQQVESDLRSILNLTNLPSADSYNMLLGRFFFIHHAESKSFAGQINSGYEFLHATFGEFLVAHIATVVSDELCISAMRQNESRLPAMEMVDQFAATLFAFQPLSQRSPILDFVSELSIDHAIDRNIIAKSLVDAAIRRIDSRLLDTNFTSSYSPIPISSVRKLATYTCNLILLACAFIETVPNVTANTDRILVPSETWQMLVFLWKSQLEPSAWAQLVETIWARTNLWQDQSMVELGLVSSRHTSTSIHSGVILDDYQGDKKEWGKIDLTSFGDDTHQRSMELIQGRKFTKKRFEFRASSEQQFLADSVGVIFGIDDILWELANPSKSVIPIDTLDAAITMLLSIQWNMDWSPAILERILGSSLVDDLSLSAANVIIETGSSLISRGLVEIGLPLVDYCIRNAQRGSLSVSVRDTFRRYALSLLSVMEKNRLSEHPLIFICVACLIDRASFDSGPRLSGHSSMVSKIDLIELSRLDSLAVEPVVTMARKSNMNHWGTSAGIVQASSIMPVSLRGMSIENAVFLILCGSLDPMNGLMKMRNFCVSWIEAHRGWPARSSLLVDAILERDQKPSFGLSECIEFLRANSTESE